MTGYAVKHSIRAEDIRILRKKLKLTQKDFAKLVNVSQKTIERWESENRDITGPVTTLVHILNEYPQIEENLRVPEKNIRYAYGTCLRVKYVRLLMWMREAESKNI